MDSSKGSSEGVYLNNFIERNKCMALVSMNDLLKANKMSSYLHTKEDGISFRVEKIKNSKAKRVYMLFAIGTKVLENAGWKVRDSVNFLWDSTQKIGVLESASASTGRTLVRYTPRMLAVRYPYIKGYELPLANSAMMATNIKVKKGRVTFNLEVTEIELE